MSPLASRVSRIESQGSRNLPSQIVVNLKQNVNAITLRSEKDLPEPSKKDSKQSSEKKLEENVIV